MRRPPLSSGDLIADRRYAYAMDLARNGDRAAAIDLIEQAIERAPGWAAAWRELGRLKRDGSDREGAASAFEECLRLDPSDAFGSILELARLGAAPQAEAAPAAYVAALFDAYAPDFEEALVGRLGYRAPQAIADALGAVAPGRRFARAIDLGCGTGLMGALIRPSVDHLEGVDLSQGMLDRAAQKSVYDRLERADMVLALAGAAEPYDLILAADVFIYTGDLAPAFSAMAARLAGGGLAAFTVEAGGPEDWRLGEALRFAHAPGYLDRLAAATSLEIVRTDALTLRKDRGADVAGLVCVVRRP